jgi:molecular chaperone DnaK (HSP70)
MTDELIVGIDFGTTNSSISFWNSKKKSIENIKDGLKNLIPSKILFDQENTYFGNYIPLIHSSDNQKSKRLVHSFKRLINTPKETSFTKSLSYPVELKDDKWTINLPEKSYQLEEVLILFVAHLKKIITKYLKCSTIKAVITVPSNYHDSQRILIKKSFETNQINVIRIINEPTAAALTYGLTADTLDKDEKILVFDIGGGTLDLSLLEIDNGFFEAVANGGDLNLGGNDFTQAIYNYFLKDLNSKYSVEQLSKSSSIKIALWNQSEKCKINLLYRNKVTLKLKNIVEGEDYVNVLTLDQFNKLIDPLVQRGLTCTEELLQQNGVTDLEHILMIGGSSRVKYLQQSIFQKFGKKPLVYHDLENVVSYGACLQAALLEKVYQNNSNIILVDVLPLSLGVKTADGLFSVIIPRNTPVPAQRTQKYTTSDDTMIDETEIAIEVYEGVRNLCEDNYLVGKFIFDIKKSVNSPVIDIKFEVDNNGIIKVSAIDKNSESKKVVVLKNVSSQLDENTLSEYYQSAEKCMESDLILEKKQQLYYKLDNMILTIKNNLLSEDIKMKQENKNDILDELDFLDESMEDLSEIELTKIIKKLEDKYANLLIIQTTEEGYNQNDKYSTNLKIEKSIEFDKDRVIDKCNYYLSLQEDNSLVFHYLIESLNEIEEIDDLTELKKKEDEIENNINKKNHQEELISLCNFLLEQINQNKLNLPEDNLNELLINITNIFSIENENGEIWKEKLTEFKKKYNNLKNNI